MKGISFLAVIPIRKEPSEQSEMVNQILFGETFDILEKQEKWSKIKLRHDKYEGWINNKQYESDKVKGVRNKKENIVTKLFISNEKKILPMGSVIHQVSFINHSLNRSVIQTAKLFLETPYLWGGRTFMGIDCSGFTQLVFRIHGIKLQRDSSQQQTQGKKIKLENARSNDLAFFSNTEGKVIHVGIILKGKKSLQIIHASGKVRVDVLDEKGIFNKETQAYSHLLHSIKRIA